MQMEGSLKSYASYARYSDFESNQALTTPNPYKVSKPISFESMQKAHELKQSPERLLSDCHMSALKTQPRQMGQASICFSPGDHQPVCRLDDTPKIPSFKNGALHVNKKLQRTDNLTKLIGSESTCCSS
jgi:hypothetical protein